MKSMKRNNSKKAENQRNHLKVYFTVIFLIILSAAVYWFLTNRKPADNILPAPTGKISGTKESAKLLTKIDPVLWSSGNYTISPDNRHIAYVKPVKNGKLAVLDGKEEKTYDDIIMGGDIPFTFSPDSRQLAYIAKQGDKELAVIDGKEGGKYDKISRRIVTFSPDSKRNGYVAEEGNQKLAVIDGKAGEKYVHILQEFIFFSPDSKRVAYTMKTNSGRLMFLDGKVLEGIHFYVLNGRLFFTPDSKQLVYVDKSREGFYSFVRANGKEYKKYYGSALFEEKDILNWESFMNKLTKHDTPQLEEIWKVLNSTGGSPQLNTTEIQDWTGLLGRLKNARGADRKIFELLGEQSKRILSRWSPEIGPPRPRGKSIIVDDLNLILDNPKLYNELKDSLNKDEKQALEKELKNVKNPADQNNSDDKSQKQNIQMFNRSLLQIVYPKEIGKYTDAMIIINSWKPGKTLDEESKKLIIEKLNRILETPDFYKAKVFTDLKVEDEFKDVFGMTMGKTRVNPVLRGAYDNRLIFDTVFEGIIAKNYFFCFGLDPTLVFSQDSKKIAYKVRVNNKWIVVADEKEGKGYEAVGIPVFSPDGNHVAYAAKEGDKQFVVVDEKEGKKYDAIGGIPIFSPDSKHVAYCAMNNKRKFVVIDGEEGKKYDNIIKENITIKTDVIQKNNMEREKNDQFSVFVKKEHTDMFVYKNSVVFTPDSKHAAYVAKEANREFVVLDGKEQKQYDNIKTLPVFSPDGRILTYAARQDENEFVVVNEKERKKYSEIITEKGGKIVFDSPQDFHYLAREDNYIYLVDEKVSE